MGWMELASAGYKVGEEAGLWKKLMAQLKRNRKVLLLGASGAGKSQFAESLRSLSPKRIPRERRTKTEQRTSARIEGTPFTLIDTPGQVIDEAKRKRSIANAFRVGVEGVINVVCYGYHEASEAGPAVALPDNPATSPMIAKPEYLEARRAMELHQIDEWIPRLDEKAAKWILTIVTKADLWWPDANQAIRTHYESGEYGRIFASFADRHYVLPYCSQIEPFFGNKTSGVFGEHQKGALREHLLETILRLSGVNE